LDGHFLVTNDKRRGLARGSPFQSATLDEARIPTVIKESADRNTEYSCEASQRPATNETESALDQVDEIFRTLNQFGQGTLAQIMFSAQTLDPNAEIRLNNLDIFAWIAMLSRRH
jgi:hypothetical protein